MLLFIVMMIMLSLSACTEDEESNTAMTGEDPPQDTAQMTSLSAADQPAVAPCPNQDILANATEFDALRTAILQGTLLYLDVPFDGNDPSIIKKKCGFESFWNPADNVDEVPPPQMSVTIADILTAGNAGICATGFTVSSFGVGEGFPEAGVYRKEFRAAFMGMTYHVRLRVTVSGTSAGNTFAAEGITVPDDIQNTLVYEVNGTPTPHNDVLSAVVNAFTASSTAAPSVVLNIRRSVSTPVILSANVEIICVAKS